MTPEQGWRLLLVACRARPGVSGEWKDANLTAVAPTYPTYQWRTPIIAALKILRGEEVPERWNLPQPKVTGENLSAYLKPNMPPLHYALCGCEDLPGFPEAWGGKKG